ncbi:MAG: hypothetical protein CMJ83_13855 [Planctomycetes bacterium]|nr:hypothetical protein [Planctomycetota bacterium]
MVRAIISVLLLGICGPAQQPNGPTHTMTINGADGPAFPISNVSLPRGFPANVAMQGIPGSPFVTYAALGPQVPGFATPYGLVDLDLSAGGVVVLDGLSVPIYQVGPGAAFTASYVVPGAATIGASFAVQTMIADVSTQPGASLTAATDLVVTAGPVVLPLTFGGSEPGRPGAFLDLAPYGISFPFYASNHTAMYVNSDGHCTFLANTTGFLGNPAAFSIGPARIAPCWTDLDPGYGGSVTVTITQGIAPASPTVTVDWLNMAEWQNLGSLHTFSLALDTGTGDIVMTHPATNLALVYDQFMGITPGQLLVPPPPNAFFSVQKNLSALPTAPITGLPNESFWEWFGIPGGTMPFYTPTFPNPWDMAGTTTTFLGMNAAGPVGTPGTYYLGT